MIKVVKCKECESDVRVLKGEDAFCPVCGMLLVQEAEIEQETPSKVSYDYASMVAQPKQATNSYSSSAYNKANKSPKIYLERRDVIMCYILNIVTFGIYFIYWMIKFHSEVRETTGHGASTGLHIVGLLFGFGIYQLYWLYRTSERLSDYTKSSSPSFNATDRALMTMLLPFGWLLLQSQANEAATPKD